MKNVKKFFFAILANYFGKDAPSMHILFINLLHFSRSTKWYITYAMMIFGASRPLKKDFFFAILANYFGKDEPSMHILYINLLHFSRSTKWYITCAIKFFGARRPWKTHFFLAILANYFGKDAPRMHILYINLLHFLRSTKWYITCAMMIFVEISIWKG